MKADLHLHSSHSFDCLTPPKTILRWAKRQGLDVIAVTDHNTIKGGMACRRLATGTGIEVIVGAEIKTDQGDLIGLFLSEEISERAFGDALDAIHRQGGLAILPHPRERRPVDERLVAGVDLIEVVNGRNRASANAYASRYAARFAKPRTGSSDAHTPFEIGVAWTELAHDDVRTALERGLTSPKGRESPYYLAHGASIASEKVKHILSGEKSPDGRRGANV